MPRGRVRTQIGICAVCKIRVQYCRNVCRQCYYCGPTALCKHPIRPYNRPAVQINDPSRRTNVRNPWLDPQYMPEFEPWRRATRTAYVASVIRAVDAGLFDAEDENT